MLYVLFPYLVMSVSMYMEKFFQVFVDEIIQNLYLSICFSLTVFLGEVEGRPCGLWNPSSPIKG